eukprot:2039588-Rhodomonas_salina.4
MRCKQSSNNWYQVPGPRYQVRGTSKALVHRTYAHSVRTHIRTPIAHSVRTGRVGTGRTQHSKGVGR